MTYLATGELYKYPNPKPEYVTVELTEEDVKKPRYLLELNILHDFQYDYFSDYYDFRLTSILRECNEADEQPQYTISPGDMACY